MKTYNSSLFDKIKQSLTKEEKPNAYKDILRFEPGNTYTVRLLPNIENPEDPNGTFFHYYQHGWTSFANGQYTPVISPATFGERDPIAEDRYRLSKTGTPEEQEKLKKLVRSEKWLCNAYIIDDSKTPENKGSVKILRYGKQLHKIIDSAINGEDSDEFGAKIFDLSPNGVSLKIKCEKQGDFPTFVSSRFASPTDLHLSDDKIEEIYKAVHDLKSLITAKSYDEVKTIFAEHFHCKLDTASNNVVKSTVKEPEPAHTVTEVSDADIDSLLKDL